MSTPSADFVTKIIGPCIGPITADSTTDDVDSACRALGAHLGIRGMGVGDGFHLRAVACYAALALAVVLSESLRSTRADLSKLKAEIANDRPRQA